MQAKDNKEKNAVEWRLVALAIDRMFFIMYLATIMVSTATILVMCFVYYTSHEAVQAGAYYIHGMNKSEYMAGYEEWMDEWRKELDDKKVRMRNEKDGWWDEVVESI